MRRTFQPVAKASAEPSTPTSERESSNHSSMAKSISFSKHSALGRSNCTRAPGRCNESPKAGQIRSECDPSTLIIHQHPDGPRVLLVVGFADAIPAICWPAHSQKTCALSLARSWKTMWHWCHLALEREDGWLKVSPPPTSSMHWAKQHRSFPCAKLVHLAAEEE